MGDVPCGPVRRAGRGRTGPLGRCGRWSTSPAQRPGQADGTRTRALTPVGTSRIERRVVGVRRAPLGTSYDPQSFHQGWAIHGSDSVPAAPASHGCVRVTRTDAEALLRLVGVGTTVHLHGGRHVFPVGSRAADPVGPAA